MTAYTSTAATQVTSMLYNSIDVNASNNAYGIRMQNLGVAGSYYSAVLATQTMGGSFVDITANGSNGSAAGIYASNGGKYYGGTATLQQGLNFAYAEISATAGGSGLGVRAVGIGMDNYAGARMNASQSLLLTDSVVAPTSGRLVNVATS